MFEAKQVALKVPFAAESVGWSSTASTSARAVTASRHAPNCPPRMISNGRDRPAIPITLGALDSNFSHLILRHGEQFRLLGRSIASSVHRRVNDFNPECAVCYRSAVDFKTRREIYNKCNPNEALEPFDPRNVELDEFGDESNRARGVRWVDRLAERVELSDKPAFVLFTGLPGSGMPFISVDSSKMSGMN